MYEREKKVRHHSALEISGGRCWTRKFLLPSVRTNSPATTFQLAFAPRNAGIQEAEKHLSDMLRAMLLAAVGLIIYVFGAQLSCLDDGYTDDVTTLSPKSPGRMVGFLPRGDESLVGNI